MALGLGFGAGRAYGECEMDFLHPDLLHGKLLKVGGGITVGVRKSFGFLLMGLFFATLIGLF